MKKNLKLIITIAVLMLLFLGACKKSDTEATPVPTVTEDLVLETIPVVETPVEPESVVTAAPASLVSGEIVFWAGAGSAHNSLLYERLQPLAQEGKGFQAVDGLTAEQITPTVRVIVSTAGAAEIKPWQANSASRFWQWTCPNPTTNLHLMTMRWRWSNVPSWLAMLWRLRLMIIVGAIAPHDDVGNRTRDSFVTGALFLWVVQCPLYADDYYPYTAEVTDPTSEADWRRR